MFFYSEQSEPTGIVTEGLALHLDAGNTESYPGTGTTWYDLSGNGNDANIVGAVYTNTNGGSIYFDAESDYASIGDKSEFDFVGNSSFTVSAFIKPHLYSKSTSYQHTIAGKYQYGSNKGWIFYISDYSTDGSGVNLIMEMGKGTRRALYTPNPEDFYGSWKYLVVVVSPNEYIKLYLNGIDISPYDGTSFLDTTVSSPSGTDLRIGARVDYTPYADYRGDMSIVKIYNRALSPAEIQQNFNATKDRFGL